jgi:1-acyl-sn-glycerol-3-phosphate acyltransferase
MRWLLDAVRFYPLLVLFALMSLAWSLPAGLLFRLLPRRFGQALGRWGISRGFRLYLGLLRGLGLLRCDFSALDALREERGIVIAPNHPSMMDAVLLTSRLPRAACITKASVWNNPLLGGGVRLAGYVRNDATLRMIREAAAMIRQGGQLMIFPEATRSPADAVLGPVTRSFAVMAQAAGAPVQTVVIERGNPFLCKGWPAWKVPPLPLVYAVRLGPRFQPEGTAEELSRRVEHALRAGLACGGTPGGTPEPASPRLFSGFTRRDVA